MSQKYHYDSLFLSTLFNQFLGLKYDLYFLKSSLPTNTPPTQNMTSPIIRDIVESVILVLASISRNGIIAMKRKNGIQKIIKNIPTLIIQFFFFILFMLANVKVFYLLVCRS